MLTTSVDARRILPVGWPNGQTDRRTDREGFVVDERPRNKKVKQTKKVVNKREMLRRNECPGQIGSRSFADENYIKRGKNVIAKITSSSEKSRKETGADSRREQGKDDVHVPR